MAKGTLALMGSGPSVKAQGSLVSKTWLCGAHKQLQIDAAAGCPTVGR